MTLFQTRFHTDDIFLAELFFAFRTDSFFGVLNPSFKHCDHLFERKVVKHCGRHGREFDEFWKVLAIISFPKIIRPFETHFFAPMAGQNAEVFPILDLGNQTGDDRIEPNIKHSVDYFLGV